VSNPPLFPVSGSCVGNPSFTHFQMFCPANVRFADDAPAMKRAGSGAIVTTTSGAALQASLTGIQAYCSTKHALLGLTRQLAHELGPYGIRVNSVAPGFIRSNPASEAQWQSYSPERQRALVEGIALKRLGTADDIAKAVMFFASDLASFVNGQVLSVDGGR